MRSSSVKVLVLTILAGAVLCMTAVSARAQSCPGSSLRYVVRDERGKVIDPSGVFEPKRSAGIDELKDASKAIKVASTVKTRVIEWRRMCNFREPVNESLTLNGKVMNVTFIMPKLSQYDTRNFLVDSLPFRAGTYEIDLTGEGQDNPAGEWLGRFYPAKAWKKIKVTPR